MKRLYAKLFGLAIIWFSRFITAVRGFWKGVEPGDDVTIYFANHTSNGDFILLWTVLPPHVRRRTRPVAAADYWLNSKLKSFIGREVINAVLIDRNPETRTLDPVEQMLEALDAGESLIIFPEGLRNSSDEKILPFKPGIYHLAEKRPDVRLVPVWIENLNRVLPKGEIIPIPFICTVTFGPPIALKPGEAKRKFLDRAQNAVLALGPGEDIAS